jgi:large subunit ribosomal protein L9
MQVILLHDVERVGHEGDILNVAGGYARNYLLPRGLAVQATRGAMADLNLRRGAIAKRDDVKRTKADDLAAHLAAQLVEVKATVGEGKRIHGQVTTQQIADAVKAQLDFELDRRDIEITDPIRETGDYLLSVRLYKDVRAQLPLRVVAGERQEVFRFRGAREVPAEAASDEAQDAVDAAEEILWDADAAAAAAAEAPEAATEVDEAAETPAAAE